MQSTSKTPTKRDDSAKAASEGTSQPRYLVSLSFILLIAFAIRMVAAIFSKGYAFNDDHFDVITIAQGWVDGLPLWLNEATPPRHSMLYVLLHYGLFNILESIGFYDAEAKMTTVRVLHGLYSLLIVYYGYKITALLSNKINARLVGILLALLWFMPFMSVRNLVEMVCIPPLLFGFYVMLRQEKQHQLRLLPYFWAGSLFALAFVFRYQTALMGGGAGLVLLYRRQWKEAFSVLIGFAVTTTLVQGTIDVIFFDYPFQSIITYFLYNFENAYNFTNGPVYRHLLTVLGYLVPPISIFLLLGYSRTAKIAPLLFWGGILFFVAHSLFPNKQERFIFSLLPIVVILGVVGWQDFVHTSAFWQNRRKLLAACWSFFWVLNLLAAIGMAFTYTKKSRIAPLVYLSQKARLNAIVMDFGNQSVKSPPLFYLNRISAVYDQYITDKDLVWEVYLTGQKPLPEDFVMVYTLNDKQDISELGTAIGETAYEPDYVVMVGMDETGKRMARLHTLFPKLKLVHTIMPSLYDKVLHYLNPRAHKDEHVQIYEIMK